MEAPGSGNLLTAITGLLSGGALVKVADLLLRRRPMEVQALHDTIETMAAQQARFDERLRETEAKVDECEAKHEACERGRRKDRQDLEALRDKFERMTKGRGLPAYHLNAPKDDPGRGEGQ